MPISDVDRMKIDELRNLVKEHLTPYYDTDFNLLRWLKGHDYNLELIKPKLINHLMFRKFNWNLDNLPDTPRDHPIHKYWKRGITGKAIKTPNCIVNIEQSGENDYWGMMKTYSINEILKARLHDLESMLRAIMEYEKEIGGLASISAFMAEHYVEMVHSFVLVNVPSFISAIWFGGGGGRRSDNEGKKKTDFRCRTVARPLLPEKTRHKVNILGSNWKEEILKIADAKCLPTYWNNEGEEGPFLAPVERSMNYPVSGYYNGEIPTNAKTIQISAGKIGYVDIEAKQNKRITWEIHSNGHFAWTIYELNVGNQTDDLSQMKNIYPYFSKIPGPTMVPMKDSVTVPNTGIYRFWFSNHHAWFHTLRIDYVIEVIDGP
ncbi:Emp24/gp25L/p24 family protein [Dictyocaulus viviparus]|uniref:Emp24/gp25L/p24 family protein n=1 Tax=Dictyocaulus viviparus TaxID=29172 RepID=A0A0D8Y831_DICVI|nr:Emp24/gp25L/p24 family protein [Dictyocaulus viviparus]